MSLVEGEADKEPSQSLKVKKSQPKELTDLSAEPRLKKKKRRFDEIDAIFGP
jgi:hypothetical protein